MLWSATALSTTKIDLEQVARRPQLVIAGQSLIARTLATLAEPLGFQVLHSLDQITTDDAWVVAAAMSSDEDHPLVRAALDREIEYVAMVASPRRTASFRDELRQDGLRAEVVSRLKAPAGLDIGAATGAEIALSILAEIVQHRRAGRRALLDAKPRPETDRALDPICGKEVNCATTEWTVDRDEERYYFCASECRKVFLATRL
jgi:xanthine dehydrogenase accessory factor